jgi:hypothetical protein
LAPITPNRTEAKAFFDLPHPTVVADGFLQVAESLACL